MKKIPGQISRMSQTASIKVIVLLYKSIRPNISPPPGGGPPPSSTARFVEPDPEWSCFVYQTAAI